VGILAIGGIAGHGADFLHLFLAFGMIRGQGKALEKSFKGPAPDFADYFSSVHGLFRPFLWQKPFVWGFVMVCPALGQEICIQADSANNSLQQGFCQQAVIFLRANSPRKPESAS
jgi:hypothetical protein